jgi:hypothetical protein
MNAGSNGPALVAQAKGPHLVLIRRGPDALRQARRHHDAEQLRLILIATAIIPTALRFFDTFSSGRFVRRVTILFPDFGRCGPEQPDRSLPRR